MGFVIEGWGSGALGIRVAGRARYGYPALNEGAAPPSVMHILVLWEGLGAREDTITAGSCNFIAKLCLAGWQSRSLGPCLREHWCLQAMLGFVRGRMGLSLCDVFLVVWHVDV